jgi:hypothetical protein
MNLSTNIGHKPVQVLLQPFPASTSKWLLKDMPALPVADVCGWKCAWLIQALNIHGCSFNGLMCS